MPDPRHIVITGAAGAIGGALAARFRARYPDATLTLVDRDADRLEEHAAALNAHGTVCDLAALEILPHWWSTQIRPRGPVDALVNCAGIMDILSLTGTGWEQGRRILDINYLAPLRLMDLAAPAMLDAGQGCIINVASMAGRVPIRGCSYYGSAKAGLAMASEIAHLEMKSRGVHVVTVYPGPVWSGLESHARAQVTPGPVARHIPTGEPEALARRIDRAWRKGQARVVYPEIYKLSRFVGQTNLAYRFMDTFSPQPNQ